MADVKVPIKFEIYKGDALVREEVLTQDVIKVGKLASSHLRIDDETVSRMHAVIETTVATPPISFSVVRQPNVELRPPARIGPTTRPSTLPMDTNEKTRARERGG